MTSVAVVIPCYTAERWNALLAAISSAESQTFAVELIVVVDHNPELATRLRAELGGRVTILDNRFAQGVSGARNTGAFATEADLVAFLDDDTTAESTWIEQLVAADPQAMSAVGAGGAIHPDWANGAPSWFPDEFLWAVGATPPQRPISQVRNVWGANMLVRRSTFVDVGGFCDAFGKLGDTPEPEDTELCLRMNAQAGVQLGWTFVPKAVVRHRVSPERSTFAFYLRRCWSEGAGKAALVARAEHGAGTLDDEADFVRGALTRGVRHNLAAAVTGDRAAAGRAAAIVAGIGAAGLGFLSTRLRGRAASGDRLLRAAAPLGTQAGR